MHAGLGNFVPDSVAEDRSDFEWLGRNSHIGPIQTETEITLRIAGKTTSGTNCLAAGILQWGFTRFGHLEASEECIAMLPAIFAQMTDPYIVSTAEARRARFSTSKPEEAALARLRLLLLDTINPYRWGDEVTQAWPEVSHMYYLVMHVLDKENRAAFARWFDEANDRLARLAPRPTDRPKEWVYGASPERIKQYVRLFWGRPMPPAVLERKVGIDDLDDEMSRYLQSIDWSRISLVQRTPSWEKWREPVLDDF